MPRLRCPRCASVIESMPGTMPVCPTCGFGSKAAVVAPSAPSVGRPLPAPAARTTAATAPPAAVAATPPPGRRGAILAVCLVGVLVLAGAAAAVAYFAMRDGPAQALSEEEARSRVAASLQAAGQALTGEASDGDLRKVTMQMDADEGAPSGPEDLFGSLGDMTVTIEYGREERVRFDLHMASGAVTVAFTMICTPERQYLLAGGEAYASRPAVEPRGAGSMCHGIDEAGMDEMAPPFDELEAEGADITRNGDGSLRAVVEEPDEGRFVVEIDADGRVRTITATPPADEGIGLMTMTFDYGSRSSIPLPADFTLMPASVELDLESEGARHTWTVVESPEAPPLDEFEARVRDWSSFGEESLAAFELDGLLQEEANLTFRFTDADGDGRLTAGDSFVVTDLSETGVADAGAEEDFGFGFSYFAYDLVLYDRVAEGEVNSGFAQAPSPAWMAWAGLALGAILGRRRLRD